MDTTELAREQAHIDRAYERLERMREQAKALTRGALDRRLSAATHQAWYERDVTVHTGLQRSAALQLGSLPLVFGRIDRADGEHYHVGRIAVHDEDLTPLVVDWRAPVAEPFYRATPHAPMGLVRRRHFHARGQRLLGMDDERFGTGGDHTDLPLVGAAALLAALSRSRTGRMTDIVETIQAEQDAVIRAPLEGVLVVQGGPGTGKTAVALHRAAYLLYTHRARLERTGVLLVGPTPVFLRYIEEVLPGLGEQRVRLATVRALVGWCVPTATDPPQVARLKGEPRMAVVLAKAGCGDSPLLTLRDLLSSSSCSLGPVMGCCRPRNRSPCAVPATGRAGPRPTCRCWTSWPLCARDGAPGLGDPVLSRRSAGIWSASWPRSWPPIRWTRS